MFFLDFHIFDTDSYVDIHTKVSNNKQSFIFLISFSVYD